MLFRSKEILKQSGFEYTKFYYPMPDYKLPNIIFSDDYLPNEESINNYIPYLSDENAKVLFDEKEAYKDLIKNNQFSFFANSFFIEASKKEFNTNVNLANQNLIKVDDVMQNFYNTHYTIQTSNQLEQKESELKNALEENNRLKEELNAIANSKSWKITKPFRDFRKRKNK